MVFWIILGIVVAVSIFSIVAAITEGEGLLAFMGIFFSFIGGLFVVGLLSGATSLWGWTYVVKTEVKTLELQALDTGDSMSGRFFLGSGYVNGERTLNYIVKTDGGWSEVGAHGADHSRIFEDESDRPVLIETYWTWGNPWLFPWDWGTTDNADFHIPDNSVVEDYTVRNE